MNEVKTPKKPFYVYYAIVLLALFLINALLVPRIAGRMIRNYPQLFSNSAKIEAIATYVPRSINSMDAFFLA